MRPYVAQTLARHSDSEIRLTLGIYTQSELADQTAAIAALLGPPGGQLIQQWTGTVGNH